MSPLTPLTATIPASYGLSLLALMRERGHAEGEVLANSQLTRAQLQDQRAQIGGWQYTVMLQNALRLDGDDGLTYELGLRSQVTKHGFVGFGLMSCGTLREAIAFSERYFTVRVAAFTSTMSTQGDQVVIELREAIALGPLRPLVFNIVLVELCTLFAKVRGQDPALYGWTSEIWVPYPEPAAYARYKDRLPRFRFNQAAVQIRFPAPMLDEPIATADPVSVQLAIDRCEQEIASKAGAPTMSAQVVSRLLCRDGHYPDVAAIARQLLVSERTLKRRLQEEGLSFQVLLDRVRHEDSLRLLANPALAIKQVAQAIGFADPANFARAFSKWTGMSPREWRQQQADRGPI